MSSSIPGFLGVCCPFLSCVYFLALYDQNACVRGCLCVCVWGGGGGGGGYALRTVSGDRILCFNITLLFVDVKHHVYLLTQN